MDISEDCWDHVGLLQEVSATEPPPPPPAPDFLIQQQEVSSWFLFSSLLRYSRHRDIRSIRSAVERKKRGRSGSNRYSFCKHRYPFASNRKRNHVCVKIDRNRYGWFTLLIYYIFFRANALLSCNRRPFTFLRNFFPDSIVFKLIRRLVY